MRCNFAIEPHWKMNLDDFRIFKSNILIKTKIHHFFLIVTPCNDTAATNRHIRINKKSVKVIKIPFLSSSPFCCALAYLHPERELSLLMLTVWELQTEWPHQSGQLSRIHVVKPMRWFVISSGTTSGNRRWLSKATSLGVQHYIGNNLGLAKSSLNSGTDLIGVVATRNSTVLENDVWLSHTFIFVFLSSNLLLCIDIKNKE